MSGPRTTTNYCRLYTLFFSTSNTQFTDYTPCSWLHVWVTHTRGKTLGNLIKSGLASVSGFQLWNSTIRVCRGTTCCVTVETNPRFAVSAATLTYESRCRLGLAGPAGNRLFLYHFWHEWQPCRFSVLVILAASTGFCYLQGLPIAV